MLLVILMAFLENLNKEWLEIISGHPQMEVFKKVVNINFLLISHQIKDFLYLNNQNMEYESPQTNFGYALSTMTKNDVNQIFGG